MRGETTVELGFTFEYQQSVGENRGAADADSVTVRAPGLSKFKVHTAMVAYVSQAMVGMMKALSGVNAQTGQADEAAERPEGDQDVMQIMAMGLSDEKFSEFCDFVRKVLTREPKLAFVGDNQPLNDDTWEAIAEAGGLEAVMKILGAFTDFFMAAQLKSAERTGNGTSISSASPTQASALPKPRTSRSKN